MFFSKKLGEEGVQQRVGALYEPYSLKRVGRGIVAPHIWLFLRKVLLGIVITGLRGHLLFQITAVTALSIITVAILATLKPYNPPSHTNMHIFNEVGLVIITNLFLT